jgi:hypothetical protein
MLPLPGVKKRRGGKRARIRRKNREARMDKAADEGFRYVCSLLTAIRIELGPKTIYIGNMNRIPTVYYCIYKNTL